MNRLLIVEREERILSALWDGDRVIEFQAEDPGSSLRVGDIYLAKVASYVRNLHAAFLEVKPGVNVFYQMPENEKVQIGEEFPVQITREAVKTKVACASRAFSIPGRYLVLVTDKPQISVSKKLPEDVRTLLKQQLSDLIELFQVGFILRTNAGEVSQDVIRKEAEFLVAQYRRIRETASFRTCYTKLFAGIPAYLALLQDSPLGSVDQIVTDVPSIYHEICMYLESRPGEEQVPVRLYQDSSLSLSSLYRIEHWLEQALSRRVWLASGGYLVIDPTEALTVIDVNTGKYDGNKKKENTFLKIDLEAAEEIVRQMRLRNLSGIILVDFIDLQEQEHRDQLCQHLKSCLAKDVVKSVFVDITPLHLAEITRKKVRGTLREQLSCRKENSEKA